MIIDRDISIDFSKDIKQWVTMKKIMRVLKFYKKIVSEKKTM